MSFLAQMTWGQWFLAMMLIFVCVFLMIVILLQRGRGGGLAGAFGGAGGTAAFGAKTGDVFTWITVVVAAIFVFLAVVANYAFDMSASPVTTAPPTEEVPADAVGTDELPSVSVEPLPAGPGEEAQPDATGVDDISAPGAGDQPVDEEPAQPATTPG